MAEMTFQSWDSAAATKLRSDLVSVVSSASKNSTYAEGSSPKMASYWSKRVFTCMG